MGLDFVAVDNFFAFVGPAACTDAMRLLRLLALRADGNAGRGNRIMRATGMFFRFRFFTLGYSHHFLLAVERFNAQQCS